MSYFFDQLLSGLALGAVYALIALGFSMVYGVLKLLNFAHSEVFTAGTFIAYFFVAAIGTILDPWLALLCTFVVAALGAGIIASIMELVAYRPIRSEPKVSVLLTAIGVSMLLQQVGIRMLGAGSRGFPPLDLGVRPQFVAIGVLLCSGLFLCWLAYFSRMGMAIRAVAEAPDVAMLMGIDANRVVSLTFFFGGAFAGIGGVVWGIVFGIVHPQMGFPLGLKAFIIAVVSGIGNLPGVLVVGVALGIMEAVIKGYIPSDISGFSEVATYGILILCLVIRPNGLFGENQSLARTGVGT